MRNSRLRPNRSVSQPITGLPKKIPSRAEAPISPAQSGDSPSSIEMIGSTTLSTPRS